jgi:hypothetical protein
MTKLINSVLNKKDQCIFCGAKKDWDTDIVISEGDNKVVVTVCPTDRIKHTISELMEANFVDSYDEVKKYIEEIMKGDLFH